jgi:phenylalanyl-tRNA synthetase beta chain
MKVSLSWLNEYTPIEMDVNRLADALTMVGLEVDAIEDRYGYLATVKVGRIESVADHPHADHLKLCEVDIGDRRLTVVCGAPNAHVGLLAPLALPGTPLPDGSILERSKVRGQISNGMLCSAFELGLGEDADGLLALKKSLRVGENLSRAMGLSDTLLDIDLTPNRPDCLSIIGVAREVAAIQKTPLTLPAVRIADSGSEIDRMTSVSIEAPDHCPRYAARLLENIRVTPSPFWLRDKLMSVGQRPINNIVDVTNFVLLEMGQPLHAFDFERLEEHRIVVRAAETGERFVSLDQKERFLDDETLMICDGRRPVGIGGVMGGLNSEITQATTRVLIESAYFDPAGIRRTSKKLGLKTEASFRFERGVDPQGTVRALDRAARLMAEVSGGQLVSGLIDEHPQPRAPKRITLSIPDTNRVLGTRLERKQIGELLASIEFEVSPPRSAAADGDTLEVAPPSFRVDIERPEDLMEEVARLVGYNRIPTTYPSMPATGSSPSPELVLRARIQDLMQALGFTEAVTYSFVHGSSAERLRLEQGDARRRSVKILNPLTEDQSVMRTSLLPGLLGTMAGNLSQGTHRLQMFEIGKIFIPRQNAELPEEIEMLAALWTGPRRPSSWHEKMAAGDFFDLKGVLEGLLHALKAGTAHFTRMPPEKCRYTRAGHTARLTLGENELGLIGEIHPEVLEKYELTQTAFVFELDVRRLQPLVDEPRPIKPLPKFPAVFRDITLIIDQQIETQRVLDRGRAYHEKLIERIDLFDVFREAPIPAGKKSISFRVTYRSEKRTLVDEEVNRLHRSLTADLMKTFNADLPA